MSGVSMLCTLVTYFQYSFNAVFGSQFLDFAATAFTAFVSHFVASIQCRELTVRGFSAICGSNTILDLRITPQMSEQLLLCFSHYCSQCMENNFCF